MALGRDGSQLGERMHCSVRTSVGRWGAAVVVSLAMVWAATCGGSPVAPTPPTPTPSAPTLTCPPDQRADSPDGQPFPVTFATPVAQGGAPPVPVACNPASPGPFPVGPTTVTCTATDARGQTGTCGFTVTVRPPPTLRFTRFLAFGDSLTSGVLPETPSLSLLMNVLALEWGYPSKLRLKLAARYRTQPTVVDNAGVPGELATEGGVARFRGDVMAYRPQVVLLMEGTNDLLSRSPDRIIPALEAMYLDAKSQGVLVMLATIPPQRPGGRRDAVAKIIPSFNEMIRALAQRHGIPLVDVFAVLSLDLSLIGQDDLHPTVQGYEVMAQVFYDAIVANLEVRAATMGR